MEKQKDENETIKQVHRHELPMGALGLAMHSDSTQLYVACMDGVYSLHAEDGKSQLLYQHESYASGVVFVHEYETLVSAGYDGALQWYDLRTREVIRHVQAHPTWSWDLAKAERAPVIATAGGQYLAGSYEYHPQAAAEPTVRVYDAIGGELLASYEHLPPVQAVAISADGKRVGFGNLMGDVAVKGDRSFAWNTPDFTAFGIIKSHCQIGGIYAAAFADDDRLLVGGMGPMRDPMAGNGKQRWQCFDLSGAEPKKVAACKDGQVGEGLMETLTMHPDGDHFVMAGRLRGGSFNVGIFSLSTGDLVQSVKTGTRVTKALFSPDGSRLFLAGAKKQSADADKQFGVVDVYDISLG